MWQRLLRESTAQFNFICRLGRANGANREAQLDTGADISCIPRSIAQELIGQGEAKVVGRMKLQAHWGRTQHVRVIEVPIFLEGRRGAPAKLRMAEVATDYRKVLISAEDGQRIGVSIAVSFPSDRRTAVQQPRSEQPCSQREDKCTYCRRRGLPDERNHHSFGQCITRKKAAAAWRASVRATKSQASGEGTSESSPPSNGFPLPSHSAPPPYNGSLPSGKDGASRSDVESEVD